MLRKISSPGIEINEIDRSQYDSMPNYSIVGTTCLICGFSDKGPNYAIRWMNTVQTLIDTYGYPTTEEEKYFFNACYEILQKGGLCLAAKLPYNNPSLSTLPYVEYEIEPPTFDVLSNTCLSNVSQFDDTLMSCAYIRIKQNTNKTFSGYISSEQYDSYCIDKQKVPKDTIRIVGIENSQYQKHKISFPYNKGNGDIGIRTEPVECMGVVPLLVSPINAAFFQKLLSSETTVSNQSEDLSEEDALKYDVVKEETTNINAYNVVVDLDTVKDGGNNRGARGFKFDAMNFSQQIQSDTINDFTMSKIAALQFPELSYDVKGYYNAEDGSKTTSYSIDQDDLKKIGVVVFRVSEDPADTTKLQFSLEESYVGSLSRTAKDKDGKSIFIDDIVNSTSTTIRMFSNIAANKTKWHNTLTNQMTSSQLTKHELASFYYIVPQIGMILGQYESRCEKIINPSASIYKALRTIFDTLQDKNKYPLDLVVDAGVSNIAWAYSSMPSNAIRNEISPLVCALKCERGNSSAWKTVLDTYDNFCKNIRKDCMFIADGLRSFCLEGNSQIIRETAPTNTMDVDVIPNLKYMAGMNTNYGAGYCDWFKTVDVYTKDMIWLPPSIKAAGIYIYTDAYYNPWDAPAGINRGRVSDVVDCAFTPNQQESGKLYTQCWNYACNYPVEGVVLEGQKTFQRKPTAFDRVNVRRLFLHLEKEVLRIARYFVYEGNTAWQRERFVDAITPLFEEAKQRNGILQYIIKCDEYNNTPNVIDNNELRCSIAVKPVKTIEFIVLNFTCTNQLANVEEELVY